MKENIDLAIKALRYINPIKMSNNASRNRDEQNSKCCVCAAAMSNEKRARSLARLPIVFQFHSSSEPK